MYLLRNTIFTLLICLVLISCGMEKGNPEITTLEFEIDTDIYYKPIQLEENDLIKSIINLTYCNGRFYITDNSTLSLGAYEKDGAFITSYTSKGRGPGDFDQVLGNLLCLPDNRILLREGFNRFHYFDDELNFLETKTIFNLNQRISHLLYATDSTYVADFLTTKSVSDEHFVIIDRNSHNAIETIGYGKHYKYTYMPLKTSVYADGKIISGYMITGKVRVLDLTTRTSHTFMTQHDKSIEEIAQGLSLASDTFPNERDIEVRTRGRAIHSIAVVNNAIFVIRDYFTETPKKYIEVFDFEGNPLRKYPLQYNIDRIRVIDGNLFGINHGGYEDFTIYQIFLEDV